MRKEKIFIERSFNLIFNLKNREFDVPSLNFAGQVHRWRLSQLLQKGFLRTQESLLSDLALASRFIVVTAVTRISGHFFSILESARALLRGFLLLVDMTVGIPSLLAHNLDYKIKEERCRFLVAELICRVKKILLISSVSMNSN